MLGYFKPNKNELKMKDYYDYRSFYCAHCHLIKNKYSRLSSILMSYEAVFISMLFCQSKISHKEKVRCTAIPIIKVPIFNIDLMKISILINQIFIYAKLKDKVYDGEWVGYKILDNLFNRGKSITKNSLEIADINMEKIFSYLDEGQKLEKLDLDFFGYTDPYKKAMEYIFNQLAVHCDLDNRVYKIIGGEFLLLMNLLDAADDYYDDNNSQSFSPLKMINEGDVPKFFNQHFLGLIDQITKNIIKLDNPYEVIILNVLGDYLFSEKERIEDKLKERRVKDGSKSKLLRYFRSI